MQFGGKRHGVCIALLDSSGSSNDSSLCLLYKAATDDCVYHVLGRKLNRTNVPVSQ